MDQKLEVGNDSGESEKMVEPSDFLCFMEKRRHDQDIKNLILNQGGWGMLTVLLNNEWEDLPAIEKKKYKEMADEMAEAMKKDGAVREKVVTNTIETVNFIRKIAATPEVRLREGPIVAKYLEDHQLCSMWSFPKARNNVAVVIYMNLYVSHEAVHIPSEIALVSFSLVTGLLRTYSTLIDPISLPLGEDAHASLKIDATGVPRPPFAQRLSNMLDRSKPRCDDYGTLVGQIETFMKQHALRETNQPFVVCLKDSAKAVKKGMRWLYAKAGIKVTNNDEHWINGITSLEKLLIVMSMAGLENVGKAERTDLKSVVSAINSASSQASSRFLSRTAFTQSSIYSGFRSIPPKSYVSLGSVRRVAPTLTNQKGIVMGAFLFEQEVTDYMKSLQYAHFKSLACNYHIEAEKKEQDSSGHIIHCAMSKAQRIVFLALDVMLVNYGIKAVRGRHFPVEHQ
ncbi:unnamed protein product [Orchesella dallaii]|uniref:Maelstrom domain-containing protein n=1 Tax=Orchesella dallaii TaxID=48710 RepID=A0ABP1R2B9_9HEXA